MPDLIGDGGDPPTREPTWCDCADFPDCHPDPTGRCRAESNAVSLRRVRAERDLLRELLDALVCERDGKQAVTAALSTNPTTED